MTIKDFVRKRLGDGADLETVWRETMDRFPGNSCSWGYVRRIKRAEALKARKMESTGPR